MGEDVLTEWARPIHDQLTRSAEQDRFSGTVLVSVDGRSELLAGYGDADRKWHKPNTPETQFRIGSLNKMFTATAALQLVQDGAIALTTRVADLIPDYQDSAFARAATVHHLLTHTSGLGDFWGPKFAANRAELRSPADYVSMFDDTPVQSEPGAQWSYSSLGYILLGRMLELASGSDYYDLVHTRIFKPASMIDTASLPEDAAVPRRSAGYTRIQAGWGLNTATLPYRGTPAGGGYSTVSDLNRFANALFAQRLLGASGTEHLLTAKTEAMTTMRYAYGFMVSNQHGADLIGHTGAAPGMAGSFWACPEQGWRVVVLSNRDAPAAGKIADTLCEKLLNGR